MSKKTTEIKLFRKYPFLEEIKCPYKPGTKESEEHFKSKTKLHMLMHDDNPYLFSGYRRLPVNSLINSFWSAFTLHNDTWNIWTHAIPIFYWIYVSITTDNTLKGMDKATWEDRLVFLFFSIGCLATMILSTMYHTWRMNSEYAYHLCLACDLRGILMTVAGGNLMSIYLMMRNLVFWRNVYITITLVSLLTLILWIPHMVKYRLTNQRTVYFAIYSFIGFVALLHCHFFLLDPNEPLHNGSLYYETQGKVSMDFIKLTMWVYFLTGLGLVVRNVKGPERFFPYIFDLHGSSHQIFHVICVASAVVNYVGSLNMYLKGAFF